jgi:hypothetical protein
LLAADIGNGHVGDGLNYGAGSPAVPLSNGIGV